MYEDINSFTISHEHSIPAINFLEKAYIGSIETDPIFISSKDFKRMMAPDRDTQSESAYTQSSLSSRTYLGEESDIVLDMNIDTNKFQFTDERNDLVRDSDFVWYLDNVIPKSETIQIYMLKSKDFYVDSQPIKFDNLGKHIHMRMGETYFKKYFRHYTIVLSLIPDNLEFRESLYKIVSDPESLKSKDENLLYSKIKLASLVQNQFPLVMRTTQTNGLTKMIETRYLFIQNKENMYGKTSEDFNNETVTSNHHLTPILT